MLRATSARAEDTPPPSWQGAALGVTALVSGDTPEKLDGALERAGYSTLPTTKLQLGPGFSMWYHHWAVGGDFVVGLSRTARGPDGARFSLTQWLLDFHGGYAVIETHNLIVTPEVIVGGQIANAEMDPYAPPLFGTPAGVTTTIGISQQSVIVGLSLGFDYQVPLAKRRPRSWGLILGTHVGYARGFPQAWYESGTKLEGGPGISGSGPFARFFVGITLPS